MTYTTFEVRKAFQTVFGSWVGTLIAQGASDEVITMTLNSTEVGLGVHSGPDLIKTVLEAKAAVLSNLPKFRMVIDGPLDTKH